MPLVANETSNAYANQIDNNLPMSSSNHKDRTEQETRVDVLNGDNIMVSLVASGESDVSSLGADSTSTGVEVDTLPRYADNMLFGVLCAPTLLATRGVSMDFGTRQLHVVEAVVSG